MLHYIKKRRFSQQQSKGYCSHHAKKRHAVNNNTLRDAQKLHKTQFRAVKHGIFVQNAHENTSRNTTCEQ